MSYKAHEEYFKIDGFDEGVKIEIIQDEDLFDPREEWEHIGTMVCFHRRYKLGDKNQPKSIGRLLYELLEDRKLWSEVDFTKVPLDYSDEHDRDNFEQCLLDDNRYACEQAMRVVRDHYVIRPMTLLDHSGLSIRIGSSPWQSDPGGWDSGFIGYIYAHNSVVEKIDGDIDTLRDRLRSEVEEYNDYLTGNCWGYVIDRGGSDNESCWGFLGNYEHCLEQAQASARLILNERKKTKEALKNNIWVNV